jgi:hypothetical protein
MTADDVPIAINQNGDFVVLNTNGHWVHAAVGVIPATGTVVLNGGWGWFEVHENRLRPFATPSYTQIRGRPKNQDSLVICQYLWVKEDLAQLHLLYSNALKDSVERFNNFVRNDDLSEPFHESREVLYLLLYDIYSNIWALSYLNDCTKIWTDKERRFRVATKKVLSDDLQKQKAEYKRREKIATMLARKRPWWSIVSNVYKSSHSIPPLTPSVWESVIQNEINIWVGRRALRWLEHRAEISKQGENHD